MMSIMMSILILGPALFSLQDAPAPHPSCCARPRSDAVRVEPPADVPAAVVAAVETLCTVNPHATDWAEGGRREAARLGFADEDGILVARPAGGTIEVVPARGDVPCLITGDLQYSDAIGAGFATVDWGAERGLPWNVRDRHGPVDAWDGPWYRAFTRGDLHVRVEHQNTLQGPLDPPADSRAKLLIRWTPDR